MGKRAKEGDPRVAVAYLRVSTEEQREGPRAQRAAIEAWAAREGVRVATWRTDEGVSGDVPPIRRPGACLALADLREQGAGVFVAAKRDRLARNIEHARELHALAREAGAVVRSADGMSDHEGPEGVLARGMPDLFAEYELALIRARTTAALAAMRARGLRTGRIPYGFRVLDLKGGPVSKKTGGPMTLAPDPHEQAIVARIVQLAGEGLGAKRIAYTINVEGLRSRAGEPFGATQVQRVLARAGVKRTPRAVVKAPPYGMTDDGPEPYEQALLRRVARGVKRRRSNDEIARAMNDDGERSRDGAPFTGDDVSAMTRIVPVKMPPITTDAEYAAVRAAYVPPLVAFDTSALAITLDAED